VNAGEPTVPETVVETVTAQSRRVLRTYEVDPGLILEHANGERRITQGGYGERQVYELVQNGADELRDDPGGEVAVVLTATHLYCANEGAPMTPAGADTILRMSVSRKRGGQIGRFGVGVKSVLSISDQPQFFSSTGGFGFDRRWAAERIRETRPEWDGDTPVLRMARPLEPVDVADPVLDELLEWATTVVRLPLKPDTAHRLAKDIGAGFPVEFPLFSPHVGTVTLEDRRGVVPIRRQIFQNSEAEVHRLEEVRFDGTTVEHEWRVFTRTHRPGPAALAAAGELHDRPEIDVSWAVPDRARSRGTFWAYFPTNYATTLRGILNAPWKTSEDRQNLFDANAFNDELLSVAAELVVDSLPRLVDPGDPGSYIDLLPGRGREAPQWADRVLTDRIWTAAAIRPSLPDQDGVLRPPGEIHLHPADVEQRWLGWWAAHPGRPADWCHPSVEQRERRARAELILTKADRSAVTVRTWLEALVADHTPNASATALRIVADMHRSGHRHLDEALAAEIVLTEKGGLVAPVQGDVFRRSADDGLYDGTVYVHDDVVADIEALHALEILGIQEADAAGRFAAVVATGFHGYGTRAWEEFWRLLRQAGALAGMAAFTDAPERMRAVHVKTADGTFRPVGKVLLPGPIVPGDGSRDRRVTVDMTFHADDLAALRELGVRDRPAPAVDPRNDAWFGGYVDMAWRRYCATLPATGRTPSMRSMRVDGAMPPGPLHLLSDLGHEGRDRLLRHLPEAALVTSWTVQHGNNHSARLEIPSPLVFMAHEHGWLTTSQGLRRVRSCVGPALADHTDLLPVAEISPALAAALGLPADPAEIPAPVWEELRGRVAECGDDRYAGRAYALMQRADAPVEIDEVHCRVGDAWSVRPAGEVVIASTDEEFAVLRHDAIPALPVSSPEDHDALVGLGMLRFDAAVDREVRYVAQFDPVPIVDEFPHLRISHRSAVEGCSLVRCTELEVVTRTPNGMRTAPIRSAVQDRTVLVLTPEDDLATLRAVDDELDLGLGADGCRSIIERRRRQRDHDRVRRAREASGVAEKLLHLIGEDDLRRGLPEGLLQSEEAETGASPDPVRIAQLAVNAHGDRILQHHRKDISARMPEAVPGFRGDGPSRRFANEIGLPESFAGTRGIRPDAVEVVDGPTAFPRLHDYQERLAGRMFDLLTAPEPARAMLCLPTGAGKTRVAAEAVIRTAKERGLQGPVLWIAQTEELCEQAVQSWAFVWSKVGPAQPLTISRLWSGNDAAAVGDTAHLVVATDAKLHQCLDTDEYAWLREPAVVLVDEAHGSITPTYTHLFRLLGLTHATTTRPLIGLTATPFRGFNEEETLRLVERYGRTRVDEGVLGDDPYLTLQDLGMLARVEHRALDGATLRLTEEELATTNFQRRLPSSAEQRLARDMDRNAMLLREIRALPGDWPIVLFAASVDHAKLMAARLTDVGIPSAAIDAATPASDRRSRIDAFRAGRIRVLTNYGVLAQGFDAPATRAVVVARPTYSPNMYQQMIGRGLRGPRNGGKETCLILDVADNIENYGPSLAFTGFEHLWGAS
jgi:superfamily II DNA or RNA helicase